MSRRLIDSLEPGSDVLYELSVIPSFEFSNFGINKLDIPLLRLLEQILRRSPG